MKKWLLTLLALVTFFSLSGLVTPKSAHAQALEIELLGKIGGMSSFFKNESLGDTTFDVGGGLQLSALCRFNMGVAIGLNFNWTMLRQNMDGTKLTYALNLRDKTYEIQHPSIGVSFRYLAGDIFDFGAWMNYGFGSSYMEYRKGEMNSTVAASYGLLTSSGVPAKLEWELDSFELGLMGAFIWRIPSLDTLAIVIGIQGFFDISRMEAADHSLSEARDIEGNYLDKNRLITAGFLVVFGARYDIRFF